MEAQKHVPDARAENGPAGPPARPGPEFCGRAVSVQAILGLGRAAGGNGRGNQTNQISQCFGLFVTDNDYLYLSDYDNHRITKWPTSGKGTKGEIVLQQSDHFSPAGLFAHKNNMIYVVDNNQDQVQLFTEYDLTEGITLAGGRGRG
ncbi:unnamed protein product [Didymodactylos carnosus]|uniref:Uncharacterized protein n=1 Tax=Didymodactylos carnosus TaxID=1234261 RepID=A0A815KD18_9BILA|nr:unnamed protein product [Didymodactylos carnosus]CAF4286057.1 unnamed protein product [Didymodactylos carnosus]